MIDKSYFEQQKQTIVFYTSAIQLHCHNDIYELFRNIINSFSVKLHWFEYL